MSDHQAYVQELGRRAKQAAYRLAGVDDATRSRALFRLADRIRQNAESLIAANQRDVAAAEQSGLAPALVERLKLNPKRVESMASGVAQIAQQVDPVGQVIEGYVRPNGLRITKVRVPIGVVLFFYESRPNVTSDAAALCIKSGNAIILRGGKEAFYTNSAIAKVIAEAVESAGLDPAVVQLVESTDRALIAPLLKQDKYIDLVIPRGGENLIRTVVAEATMPVLKHFTGNCHIYIDQATVGMDDIVSKVCVNAKTSYPGGAVCNAAEKLIFHKDAADRLLKRVCEDLAKAGVEIRGDERARRLYPSTIPATQEDWPTEYLAFTLAVKVVDNIDEAIAHINEYGSHHTDAILSSDVRAIQRFSTGVDTASVMVNASTRFADGGEYGLGAEIGISTDKLHARGPMGALDLTTYKWIVTGEGHVR